MSVIIKLKNNIRKYIFKYISFLFILFLIPCFSITSFADSSNVPFAIEIHNYDEDSYINYGSSTVQIDTSLDKTPSLIFDAVIDNSFLTDSNEGYYFLNFVIHQSIAGDVKLRVEAYSRDNVSMGSIYRTVTLDNAKWNSHTISLKSTYVSTVTNSNSKDIARYRITCSWPTSSSAYSESLLMSMSAVSVGSDGSTESIIAAINSQTSSLGGKLDKGNDLLENGNSDTQSSISDFNQVFEDFNQELENWEQFDDEIIGEFNSANDNYMAELDNFSLSGSLLNAGNWLSTSMQTVYDNSSDYKILWLVPLLFGIPILLFIIRKNGDDE